MAGEEIDATRIRELLLDFYTENDPQRLNMGLDIFSMVVWTQQNGLASLNDLLEEQYGSTIDPDKQLGDAQASFKRFSTLMKTDTDDDTSMRNHIYDQLVAFYEQRDQSKIGRLNDFVQYIMLHGLEAFNRKLFAKYGEGITLDEAYSKRTGKASKAKARVNSGGSFGSSFTISSPQSVNLSSKANEKERERERERSPPAVTGRERGESYSSVKPRERGESYTSSVKPRERGESYTSSAKPRRRERGKEKDKEKDRLRERRSKERGKDRPKDRSKDKSAKERKRKGSKTPKDALFSGMDIPPPPPIEERPLSVRPTATPVTISVEPAAIDLRSKLVSFYNKHDASKLNHVDSIVEWGDQIGVQELDDKLTQIYGVGFLAQTTDEEDDLQDDLNSSWETESKSPRPKNTRPPPQKPKLPPGLRNKPGLAAAATKRISAIRDSIAKKTVAAEDGPCSFYELDMTGTSFGVCRCGYSRIAHRKDSPEARKQEQRQRTTARALTAEMRASAFKPNRKASDFGNDLGDGNSNSMRTSLRRLSKRLIAK